MKELFSPLIVAGAYEVPISLSAREDIADRSANISHAKHDGGRGCRTGRSDDKKRQIGGARAGADNSSCNRQFDVVLAGYYGFGNLGDELLAEASVDFLKASGVPRERIAILSADPAASAARLGVMAFDRWNFSSVSAALSRSRSLLLGGGGLFQDASSVRSCLYYWGLVRLAQFRGCSVWGLGQSVGPLSGRISRLLTRDALSRCSYLAVRDRASAEVLNSMGIAFTEMPDIVLGLSLPARRSDSDSAVLINIRPVQDDPSLCDSVAIAARRCVEHGMSVKCIALSSEDESIMREKMDGGELPYCEIVTVRSLEDFIAAADGASYAVGMRLHFGVLSMLSGLRLILVPYDPKVSGFAESWGISLLEERGKADCVPQMLKDIPDVCSDGRLSLTDAGSLILCCFKEGLKSL